MFPLRTENTVDSEPAPADFEWLEGCGADDSLSDCEGCRCPAGQCIKGACPCTGGLARDTDHLVVAPDGLADPQLSECGPSCSCWRSGCALAFSASTAAAPACLRKHAAKGWCVLAEKPFPAGVVLGIYAGEYVSNEEAQRRLREYDARGGGHALLVMREWLPSGLAAVRTNIDATRRGNLCRFLNHSCDGGNLRQLVGRRAGCLLPRVVFVTTRAVQAGEELTWAYGPPNAGPLGQRCHCGTPACRGFMPHEAV